MTSSGRGRAQFPVEIWQQIAGHMSSKCWTRVSRACRAMHSVQPKQINISVERASALAWVQTHWGQATSMKLTWVKRNIPWVMAHNAASVTSLKRLELGLVQETSPTTTMLLTWVIAQASQLQLLSLQHPTALVVPPICNLRHLIMTSSEFTATSAASIRQLRNLQTLWLGRGVPKPNTNSLARQEFDLVSLLQLMDICVDSVSMARITLPRQCRLHLVGAESTVFQPTWFRTARQRQVHSIKLRCHLTAYGEIPRFLLESKCAFLYWWDMKQLGDPASPVLFGAAQLSCLTHVYLQGKDIHIVLPKGLPLQVLHVHAMSLSIVYGNPQEQAKRLQQLIVTYCTLHDTDITVLVGLMCGMGAKVKKLNVRDAAAELDKQHGFCVRKRYEPWAWKCPCGACLGWLDQI